MDNATLATVISGFGTLFVIYLIIKYGVSAGVKGAGQQTSSKPSHSTRTSEQPQKSQVSAYNRSTDSSDSGEFNPFADEPGKFLVEGVDIETHHDVRLYINAASPDAAKVKAKLKGVEPTNITRV